MTNFFQSRLGKLSLVALCALVGWLSPWPAPSFLDRLDMTVFDHYQAAAPVQPSRDKIIVVLATENSMREFGRWPWPRGVHAGVIGRLGMAKRVMLDVLFPEQSNPDEDSLLAAVVKEAGNVTVAVHLVPGDEPGRPRLLLPYPALAEAAVDFGIANVTPEPDGIYRDGHIFWIHQDELVPSLPSAAWLAALGAPPDLEWSGNGYKVLFPGGAFGIGQDLSFKVCHPSAEATIYEYADVYHGLVAPETFRDALVFVGVNAMGAMDFLPVGLGRIIPGTVYNAHAALTLIQGWIVESAPTWASSLAGAVLAVVGAIIGLRQRVRSGWLWLALALLALFGLTFGLFLGMRLWLPPVRPALVGLAASFLCIGVHLRYLSEEWRAQVLSADAMLFLGGRRFDPSKVSLAEYLGAYWKEVEKWSGVSLEIPAAPADDSTIAECLKTAALREDPDDGSGVKVIPVGSRGGKSGRLLLRLPGWDDDKRLYALLAWRGNKSPEILKSASALIFSAAANYKAAEESQAKKELFLGVIRLIMGAVDAKDPTTAGHSERVAVMARELAGQLGLSTEEIEEVYLSGLLHDVGKIGIPDSVLAKPGRLDDEEMAIMRRHPSLGAELMRQIKLPAAVIAGIIEHHERPDGKGYPNRMPGERISRVGAILKVADVYDALASKRQYKEPMPLELVRKIITEGAGPEFDPEIVTTFLTGSYASGNQTPLKDGHNENAPKNT